MHDWLHPLSRLTVDEFFVIDGHSKDSSNEPEVVQVMFIDHTGIRINL